MARQLVSVAWAWPSGRFEGVPVDGPDEDAFTLAVKAVEQLPARDVGLRIGKVRVLGDLPPETREDLGEAIGSPTATGEVGNADRSGFWGALLDAAGGPGESDEVVVAIASPRPPSHVEIPVSGGAIAIGLSCRAGVRPLGAARVPYRLDRAEELPRAARELWPSSLGRRDPLITYLSGGDAISKSSATTHTGSVSGASRVDVRSPESWRLDVPTLVEVHRALTFGSPGPFGFVYPVPEGSMVMSFEREAPISGAPIPDVTGSRGYQWDETTLARRPSSLPPNVSEGAYVPRSTYREQRPSRWRFAAEKCPLCGAVTFPARGRCSACGNETGLARTDFSRRSLQVEATTIIHRGAQPTEFDLQTERQGDYEVVVARVSDRARVTLQVTDAPPGTIRIGDRVDAVLRRLIPMEGAWRYGLKAIPSGPGSEAASTPRTQHRDGGDDPDWVATPRRGG